VAAHKAAEGMQKKKVPLEGTAPQFLGKVLANSHRHSGGPSTFRRGEGVEDPGLLSGCYSMRGQATSGWNIVSDKSRRSSFGKRKH